MVSANQYIDQLRAWIDPGFWTIDAHLDLMNHILLCTRNEIASRFWQRVPVDGCGAKLRPIAS